MTAEGKVCSDCGLPKGIGRGNIWHSNGVITARYPPYIRGTLYDVDELNNLVSKLSERMQFDITTLVVEGKRRDGVRFANSLLGNLRDMGAELPPPIEIYNMVCRFCATWGLGRVEVGEYVEGEKGSLKVEEVYSIPMFSGDSAGTFEAVEQKRMDVEWHGDAVSGILELVASGGEPVMEQRIEQEVEMGIPCLEEGDLEYRLCPECGAPLEISAQFEWDELRARITERDSGKRYILHNTNGIVAVVRSLREELGEDVEAIITDISRTYARNYYSEIRKDSSIDAELLKFPLRSWGRPSRLLHRRNSLNVTIINSYSPPVVAGRLWGLLEVFEECDLALEELREEEGVLDLVLVR
jgi:hypothetical protein